VGEKETLGDTIRVVIVIHMLMVTAMFAGPEEYGMLKRSGSKNNREEPHNPVRLEGQMREKSVVPERNRESERTKHRKEKCDLKPVDAKKTKVQRHSRDRQEQSADQK